MAVQSRIVLEPSAQGIVDAASTPPFLFRHAALGTDEERR
jgi:hypothetical protein